MNLLHLIKAESASPLTVSACFHLGLRDDIDLAVAAVQHPNASAAVLDVAATSTNPKVRVAWLQQPNLSAEQVLAALQRERRGDVLAALVPHVVDDVEMLEVLAMTGKRPVALELARLPECPDSVARHIIVPLDRLAGRGKYDDSVTAIKFLSKNPDLVLSLASELRSLVALQLIVENPSASADDLAVVVAHGVENFSAHPDWDARRRVDKLARALLFHPNVTFELIDRVEKACQQTWWAKELPVLVEQARQSLASRADHDAIVAEAGSGTDVGRIVGLWVSVLDNSAFDKPLVADVAVASLSNPVVDSQHVREHVALVARLVLNDASRRVAAVVAERFGDDVLTDVLSAGYWDVTDLELVNVASDPETVRRNVVLRTMSTRRYLLVDAVEFGWVDALNIGLVPMSQVAHARGGTRAVELVEQYLAATLADDLSAWEMFVKMMPSFPGTLAELTSVARAATGSPVRLDTTVG